MSRIDIFDKTYDFLKSSLDISARKHSLTSSNIANMDTVGYTPKHLDFAKALELASQKPQAGILRTHPKHIQPSNDPLNIAKAIDESVVVDEYHLDTVNIDMEMSDLAENNLKYKTSVEMILRKINMLRNTIIEGGR